MDCSGVAARDILSLFLCLLSATLHSWRCLYTIYLHPRSYFLSIWLSLVCSLIFSCQSPLPPSIETRLPSHRFLYFFNLKLFLLSTILSTHVYLCWFSTQFYVLLWTFYRHFVCRYLPLGQFFFFLLVFSVDSCLSADSNFSLLSDLYIRTCSCLHYYCYINQTYIQG
jgi:hypothetical protein